MCLNLTAQSYLQGSAHCPARAPHPILLTFENEQDVVVTLQRRLKLAQFEVFVPFQPLGESRFECGLWERA